VILRGRRRECNTLDRLLDGARAGQSATLVLSGEAGIGKSALLEWAGKSAPDMTILRAVGVQSQTELPFAGLHQFCAPLLDLLDRLPAPQSKALETTFGLSSGTVPDQFLVGLAVVGLLSEATEGGPVLCIVDDTQWLDKASAEALVFVARRLLAESVVMLFATRGRLELLARLPELTVEGLAYSHARELLGDVVPGPLDERVAARLVVETKGNPLALLELPRGLAWSELAGGFGLSRALSLQSRIEESYRQRLDRLPQDTQTLLLLAAAEPLGDPALLWRAAHQLGIPSDAAHAAETQGLFRLNGTATFRHPLVRSTVYGSAEPSERREAHRALADATDPQLHPDRRAWHLAEAASMPDEEVAAELELSALRAQARGGVAAAAAFLERATELTPAEERRSVRALAAAEAKVRAGALCDALRLVGTAESGVLNEIGQARAGLLRGRISFNTTRSTDAAALLLSAAKQLETLDFELSRETYLDALTAAMFAGSLAGSGATLRNIAEAASAAPRTSRPRSLDLLLDGFSTALTESYASAVPILRQAQSAIVQEPQTAQVRRLWAATVAAMLLWDDEAWERLADLHLELIRETGTLGELVVALGHRGQMHVFAGQFDSASSVHEALQSATELTGSLMAPYDQIGLVSMRGREDEARRVIDKAHAEAVERGEGAALWFMDWGESVLYNGLGRYEEAVAAARRVVDGAEFVAVNWALPELIEAAVRVGDSVLAGDAEERLTERSRASGTEWALGVTARSRALLADDEKAEELYNESIERLAKTRAATDLARAHLVYGEWLRRQRRGLEARGELRTAYEMFTEFGMDGFAQRTRVELLATGERRHKLTVETTLNLTPQEAEIAGLARDGLSNREISERLFISKHTVEYHLHKVFGKLSISSRNKLAQVLPSESSRAVLV
jgi:DNA-binding CsgD family transcriptional regulator